MTQLNLPRKRVALAQVLISLLLIVLTLILSFTAVLSIDISDSELRKSVQATVDSLSENVDGLDSIEIPEKIDVTMPKLVKADMIFFKLINVATKSVKSLNGTATQQERADLEKAADELEKMVMSEDGQEALLTVVAAVGQVVDLSGSKDVDAEDDSNQKSTVGEIILMIIRIIAMIYILIFITIFPITVGITALVSIIRVLTHLKNPEEVCGKVSGKMISLPLSLHLL